MPERSACGRLGSHTQLSKSDRRLHEADCSAVPGSGLCRRPPGRRPRAETAVRLRGPASEKSAGPAEILHLQKAALIDQTSVASARVGEIPMGLGSRFYIDLTFTGRGKETLARVTRENLGRRLAFLIDGRVVLSPVINSAILDGKAMLEGEFTKTQADELAAKINRALGKKK
jgi:preprotein translocase subunit SecD